MAKSRHRNKKYNPNKIKKVINNANAAMMQQAVTLAEDAALPDKERGLYARYRLARVDGSTDKGGKHSKCDFFVLDITHDPHAVPALFSYAVSAQADGYEKLAADLFSKIQPYVKQLNEAAGEDVANEKDLIGILPDASNHLIRKELSKLIFDTATPGTYEHALLTEALVRLPKNTRKKKSEDIPAAVPAAAVPAAAVIDAAEAGVGICQTCNKPVGMFGDSHHKALGEGKFICDEKYKDTDSADSKTTA